MPDTAIVERASRSRAVPIEATDERAFRFSSTVAATTTVMIERVINSAIPLLLFKVSPIICDNNFLACSKSHREKVYNKLFRAGFGVQIDFNQGLDARLMNEWDAKWLSMLRAKCRLTYDYLAEGDAVRAAVGLLRDAGVPKNHFSFYALVGWKDTPEEAWKRCVEIDSWNMLCCPMWFHELDAMEWNKVTEKQLSLGWTEEKRKHIMGYFWQHRGIPPQATNDEGKE